MQQRSRRPRGILTQKISISVSRGDLKKLVARAKRSHGGNVSAVVAEMVAALSRAEAADEVLRQLGGESVTEKDMQAIRAEVFAPTPQRRKRPAA